MDPTICFSSDFGLSDTWVGVCHAVIHRACPRAYVVDLGHDIPPFDVRAGAILAAEGAYQLPDALHLVVVDPGVGGPRRDVCVVSGSGTLLVGPDNGVLVPAALRTGGLADAFEIASTSADTDGVTRSGEPGPLATFHARDVLAPAVAALACGAQPSELGGRLALDSLAPAPFDVARCEGGFLLGEVLGADRFGSVRMSITADDVVAEGLVGGAIEFSIGHATLNVPVRRTFDDVGSGDLVALVDSSGWLTLAQNQGSAVERLGVGPGVHVRVRRID